VKEEQVHIYISDVLSGNTAAFSNLVDEYKSMVYSICLKIISQEELAEEAAQDTFVKAFQSLNKFKGKAKFSTWLYQIAYFTAINATRKHQPKLSELDEIAYKTSDSGSSDILENQERKELLHKAIQQLKADERGIITLYYLEEMSIEEVASITRLTISNVKVKAHRCRKKLYHILEQLLQDEFKTIQYE